MFCVVELVPVVRIFTWLLLDIVPEYPEFIVTVFIGIIGGGGDGSIDEISVCEIQVVRTIFENSHKLTCPKLLFSRLSGP